MRMVQLVALWLLVSCSVLAEQPPNEIRNSVEMTLVLIPSGSFSMGSASGDDQSHDDERQHQVRISEPFYMGTTEVTQAQFQKVMGFNPSKFRGVAGSAESGSLPVEQVSWSDAVGFCNRLSSMPGEKKHNRTYLLPTEAQWEYACRAGNTLDLGFESNVEELSKYAWFGDNSGEKLLDTAAIWKSVNEDVDHYLSILNKNQCRPHKVGQKNPNPWGLYDMHGNVWEWCSDWYAPYPKGVRVDPVGALSGTDRVLRGGGYHFQATDCRCAERHGSFPSNRVDDLGFRVVLRIDK